VSTQATSRLGREPVFAPSLAIEAALLVVPFAVSLYWVAFRLEPLETHDSFAYLWRAPLSAWFFTGRSLTQRVLFAALGNNDRAISVMHVAVAAATIAGIHLLVRQSLSPRGKLMLAGLLAFIATSGNFALAAVVIAPEPIFLSLMVLFPFVLVLAEGRFRPVLLLLVGVAAVFTKNVAPPVILAEILALALLRVAPSTLQEPATYKRAATSPEFALIVVSLAAATITHGYDTSVQLNAMNNTFQRVLPDDGRRAHFQERHEMPTEDVLRFQAQNNLMKVDEQSLFHIDEDTRNYELARDVHPLVTWVADKGWGEYWEHLALHEPWFAYAEVRKGLAELFDETTITFLGRELYLQAIRPNLGLRNLQALSGGAEPVTFDERYYLEANPDVAQAVREGRLSSGRQHYDAYGRREGRLARANDAGGSRYSAADGLLGFDPLALLAIGLAQIGFRSLGLVLIVTALSLVVARRASTQPLRIGVVAAIGGLCGFVFSFLGDPMDARRHVFVSLIVLTGGLTFQLVGLASRALRAPK
jgi:hypothetical protein